MIQVRSYADFKSLVPTTTLFIFYYLDAANSICSPETQRRLRQRFVTANLTTLPRLSADYASHGARWR
jgi:hypothetical protein